MSISKSVWDEWPANGKIEFNDIWIKYRENLPCVLKGLNLTINPQEKVCTYLQ